MDNKTLTFEERAAGVFRPRRPPGSTWRPSAGRMARDARAVAR